QVAGAAGPMVTVTATAAGARLRLTMAVDNATALSLQSIDFPVLPLGALGGDGSDDTFFFARASGEVQPDPAGRGANWGGLYPGGWSTMQYEAVYDPQGGVYLAAEDPVASTKSIYARGPNNSGAVRYGVNWPAPDMSRPGNDWTVSGEAAVELFQGDWFDAAQIYRAWAERAAAWWPARTKERPTPRWFTELPAWVLTSGHPYEPDKVVPKTLKFAEAMGVPTALHWYNWHVIPFDNDYPHYNPTKPRVAEGVAELKAAGVKVMPYINGRLWDSSLEDFKTQAHAFATKDEAGQPYLESYSSKEADGSLVKLAAMCPATAFWQDKQQEIVLWLQNEVGVDGVYMDQIAAATPRICMDPSHGHPLGGGHWWTTAGYWPMLQKIRAAMGPDKFLTTECNAEPYAHVMDGYLTWHWQFQNQVPAFSAVYADQIPLFSRAYRGGPTQDLANRMKAGQSLCFGEQIGWVSPDVVNRPSGAFIAACAKMRWELRAYLAGGRMLRVPRLEGAIPEVTADWQWSGVWPVTLPAVQSGAWQAPDGRAVVILANVSDQPVTVRYPFNPRQLGFNQDRVKVTRRTGQQIEPGTWWSAGDRPELTIPAEQIVALELDF
ncbi:MAG: hypothetical protein HUU35_15120, partial [Armatimonadetes bacterium]|nr:hypothetical protein [Armatimonadota bacterium]